MAARTRPLYLTHSVGTVGLQCSTLHIVLLCCQKKDGGVLLVDSSNGGVLSALHVVSVCIHRNWPSCPACNSIQRALCYEAWQFRNAVGP